MLVIVVSQDSTLKALSIQCWDMKVRLRKAFILAWGCLVNHQCFFDRPQDISNEQTM